MVFKRVLLILWLLFSLLSLNLFTAVEEEDYPSMTASNLVKRLMSQNPGIRSMAFYELRRRYPLCPETRSYAEFAKDIKIWEVIECPPGKNKPPVYLVLFDLQYESSYPGQDYRTPAREIFEKKRDKTGLKWENNINITAFDSAGGDLEIPGCHEIHHGVIADINGDGLIEVVDTFLENKLDDKPQGMVLKVWTIKETPQCIFALLYNLGEGDWGYALEDKDNDGIYDILLGPGKPGDVTPVVTYKWDKGKGTYNGPPGGENDCFRITDAAAVEEEPGEVVIGSFPKDPWESGPKFQNYNKPYSYFSLKNLSNREILEYMKEGETVHSLEWEAVKPKFPREFQQKKPKEAVLDLIEMNRNPEHKRQFQIAVDDRSGLEFPAQCRIFYSYVDNPFHPVYQAHYFIRCTPGDSYLAYAVCGSAGPFHIRLSDQEAVFKFRLCPIPYEIARHFVESAWWLNQVRSRESNDDMGFYSMSGSTTDGHGSLMFKSGLPELDFSISGTVSSSSITEVWSGEYDKETCLNFFTYLLRKSLMETLKTCVDDSNLQLPGKDQRTAELAEFFMENFSFDESKVSIPIATEAVRYAGVTASKSHLPLLEKIHKQLSLCDIPQVRPLSEVYHELKIWEDKDRESGNDVPNEKTKALRDEYNQIEAGSSSVALDRLREAILISEKQIALALDGAALEKWVKSGEPGATSWAIQQLKINHPKRYIELMEQQVLKNTDIKAIEAFGEIEDLDPKKAAALSEKLLAMKRKDLFIPAFQVLVKAKKITRIKDWLPELVEWLTATETAWRRYYIIHLLVPGDDPLKYKDKRIDQALGTLLNAGFKDNRVQFLMDDICRALALRGKIEYFYKIKECIETPDQIYTKREILLYLTYLALQNKGNYLSDLQEMLERYLKGTDIKKAEVILSIWAADFKQFKAQLEEIATSGPGDYEDTNTKTGGRYHMARKVCALWNEEDPVTRYKLWIAFALKDYCCIDNSACKLRFEEEFSVMASRLTRKQKDAVLMFIDYCYQETTHKRERESKIWKMLRNKIK